MRRNACSAGLLPALLICTSLFAAPAIAVEHFDGEGQARTQDAACDLAKGNVRYRARCLPGYQVTGRTESECTCQLLKETEGEQREFFHCMTRVSWQCVARSAATSDGGDCLELTDAQERLACFQRKVLDKGAAPKAGTKRSGAPK